MSTQTKISLRWTARILAIIYIVFLAVFALDAIRPEYSFRENLAGLILHLIPNFVLLGALVIAWRRPIIGGAIFLILAIIGTSYFHTYTSLDAFVLLSLPSYVIGFLFVVPNFSNKQSEEIWTS